MRWPGPDIRCERDHTVSDFLAWRGAFRVGPLVGQPFARGYGWITFLCIRSAAHGHLGGFLLKFMSECGQVTTPVLSLGKSDACDGPHPSPSSLPWGTNHACSFRTKL